MTDWSFDAWPAIEPKWHDGAAKHHPWDTMQFHVDLGCGTLKKARIGIDRYPARGVNVLMNLDEGRVFAIAPEPGRDAAERLGNGWRYRTPMRVHNGRPAEYLDYPDIPELPPRTGWQYARGISEPLTIRCGLPFEDNQIRSIITHHALEHIGAGFIPLMDDIYRVLEPGGILRAITPLWPSNDAVGDPDHCRYFTETTWLYFCGHLGSGNNPTGIWTDVFSVPYTRARFEMLSQEAHEDALRVTLRAVK